MVCAWDSNPRPQDGKRRRNHGAMAADLGKLFYSLETDETCVAFCQLLVIIISN